MIKNISEINKKPKAFIKEFANNCIIEEKIDAHYITLEIISKNTIKLKKSNNKEIDRVDLILNNIWGKIMTEWNYIKIVNNKWFNNHIGYKISMFYFPFKKPISIEYSNDVVYLIDRVVFNDEEIKNIDILFKDIKYFDRFKVKIKNKIEKSKSQLKYINDIELSKSLDYSELFLNLIDSNVHYLAADIPEGVIFKWKKNNYQILFNVPEKIESEKSSYEFLLCDFINYCKKTNYIEKINQSYVKTVCALFNDYILNSEQVTHNIEHNIDPSKIKNPCLGTYTGIGYEYIPDSVTKNICKENELYEDIFKVLLANLRKGKDNTHCIYMNAKQVDDWNNIMKNIKVRTLVI